MIAIMGHAQSSSPSLDTPSVPIHSGKAAGATGPKVNAGPPARQATNPVNQGKDNSPKQTFTGVVSDSFCGKHHYMLNAATDKECTRYCVAHQGNYVLIVGDKLYASKTGQVMFWTRWRAKKRE